MKKLILAFLLPLSLYAEIKYDDSTGLYYSTKIKSDMDPIKYHYLAHYCSMLIDAADHEGIDLEEMLYHIREILIRDRSREAGILYDDLSYLWNN